MSYAVKEIFLTLQGEGAHAGRTAVFCRFAGCNLWSGREQDRATAVCQFCDTDFVGTDGTLGGRYATADELADKIAAQWTGENTNRYVVLTGGEPMLQVDAPLVDALHARGFAVGVETNGTRIPADLIKVSQADLEVRAPAAGTVITRSAEPGRVVAAGATILSMLDLSSLYLRGFVPEGQIGAVVPAGFRLSRRPSAECGHSPDATPSSLVRSFHSSGGMSA